jgi:hypothetical protein
MLQKCAYKLHPVRVSIHLHVTTRERLHGFSWNFTLKSFATIRQHIPGLFKIEQQYKAHCMETNMLFFVQKSGMPRIPWLI